MVPSNQGWLVLRSRIYPEPLHQALKKLAEEKGRSLNAQILDELAMSVAEAMTAARLMRSRRAEFSAFVESLPKMSNSVDLIREDRDHEHQ